MKTIYLTIILLFASIFSFAQEEVELFGEWFLNHRTFGPTVNYPPFTVQEDYNVILNFSLLPPNAGNPFVIESYGPTTSTYEGRFSVDNGIMEIYNVNETVLNCEHPLMVCSYFDDYNNDILFDPDTLTETGEHIVAYEVIGNGNDAILTITNDSNGEQAVYGRQPATYNDITGNWYVQSIITNGVQHDNYVGEIALNFNEIPSNIENALSFIGWTACNGYLGSYSLLSENTLTFVDWAALDSCSSDDAYGRYYFKYSDIINPGQPFPLEYEIVGTGIDQALTITNSEGDSVVLGKETPTETIFKTWYSYSTETAEGIAYPTLNEAPSLTILATSSGAFGMGVTGSGGCNDFDASHNIYSSNENEFWIYLFNQTLLECNDNLYEPTYLSVLSTEVDAVFSYELQDEGETLVFTNTVGEVLTFGSQPLPQNILGEWLLHYLVIDSNQISNPEGSTPTISFEITPNSVSPLIQGIGACNGYSSSYHFNPQQSFTSDTFGTSLVDCDTQEENEFENYYFTQVLNTGNDGATELHHEITGTEDDATLVVTNLSNGNQAFYGRQALSVDDNEFGSSKISLSENPVGNTLSFTSSENLSESNYQIYDITGKLIVNGLLNSNSIDVKSLASGLYMLKIYNQLNRFETVKFIKE